MRQRVKSPENFAIQNRQTWRDLHLPLLLKDLGVEAQDVDMTYEVGGKPVEIPLSK
jgi:hypothetical protein